MTPALQQQHERWAAAHARLRNSVPPQPKPEMARPESPFAREARELRAAAMAEARAAFERQEQRKPRESSGPHWLKIVQEVAEKHDISPKAIRSSSRRQFIVRARNEVFWRMRHEIVILGDQMSMPVIASKFGMDHTTILHGIRKHAKVLAEGLIG